MLNYFVFKIVCKDIYNFSKKCVYTNKIFVILQP